MKKFTILCSMKRAMFCFMLSLALACLFGNNAKAQTVYPQNNCSTANTLGNADTCNPAVQAYGHNDK